MPAGHSTAPESGGRHRGTVVVGMLFLFMMINFADKAVLGLAATSIVETFGITPAQYGTIASSFFLLFSVSAFAVGYLADRFSSKRLLTTLMILWAVSMIPVLGPAGFMVLLLSRIFLGFAEGPAYAVANHAMMSWFEDRERNIPAALLGIGAPIGVVVASPILTWVIVSWGWRAAFVVLIIVSLLWCVVWVVVGGDGPLGVISSGSGRVSLWRTLLTSTSLGCALSAFAAYWALALIVAWVPPYLEAGLGYSRTETGFLTTLPWIAMTVAALLLGFIVQRLLKAGVSGRMTRGVIAGACVLIGGLAVLGCVHTDNATLSLILMSIGFGIPAASLATSGTALSQIAPINQRGAVLGAFVAFYSIAGIVAPYLTGRLVGQAGAVPLSGYTTMFTITAMVLIVGGLAAILMIKPERDHRRLMSSVRR
jgi:MFS family permease